MQETVQEVRPEDTFTVKEIWEQLGGKTKKISLSQVYNLIEREVLKPAYRFAGSRGTCVPKNVVLEYKRSCLIDGGR